jgi:hypothetical protein
LAEDGDSSLLLAAPVSCERKYLDRFGRTVAQCFSDGRDIAAELVLQATRSTGRIAAGAIMRESARRRIGVSALAGVLSALVFIGVSAYSIDAEARGPKEEVCYQALLDAATGYALANALYQAEDEQEYPGIVSRIKGVQDLLARRMTSAVDAGCPTDPFEKLVACLRLKNDGSGKNVMKAGQCVEEVTGRRDVPFVEDQ